MSNYTQQKFRLRGTGGARAPTGVPLFFQLEPSPVPVHWTREAVAAHRSEVSTRLIRGRLDRTRVDRIGLVSRSAFTRYYSQEVGWEEFISFPCRVGGSLANLKTGSVLKISVGEQLVHQPRCTSQDETPFR